MSDASIVKIPYRGHSPHSLFEKLREVKLRGSEKQPYKDAFISIEYVDPNCLAPCQRYVLSDELRKIEEVRWHLLEAYGIDIFKLHGFIEGFNDPPCDILPVIVEEVWHNHRPYLVVADGQHRSFLARQYGMDLAAVYIRGASEPYYAYPLSGGWNDVEIIDQLSPGYIKKFHVRKEYRKLFRDFTTVFNNLSVSRPITEKS